jgi:hypothetical protein
VSRTEVGLGAIVGLLVAAGIVRLCQTIGQTVYSGRKNRERVMRKNVCVHAQEQREILNESAVTKDSAFQRANRALAKMTKTAKLAADWAKRITAESQTIEEVELLGSDRFSWLGRDARRPLARLRWVRIQLKG